jgi:hypothetical protein
MKGRLGIMQPYFFPYVGYFSLIQQSESFILFDTVQFIRHGWIERNRVLKPQDGWQYISVPLEKHNQQISIKDVMIREEPWRERIFRQLEHYKKRSPYYHQTIEVLQSGLQTNSRSIVEVNQHCLKKVCEYVGIETPISIWSQQGVTIEEATEPGKWAMNICEALGYKEYINPPGGMELFDREAYAQKGIQLSFLANEMHIYSQRRENFENGLSILDLMMFNDSQAVFQMINQVKWM